MEFVERFGLEPSGFSGENVKLQKYIESQASQEQSVAYRKQIEQTKNATTDTERKEGKVLRKEELSEEKEKVKLDGLWVGVGVVVAFITIVFFIRRRKRR